MKDSEDSFGLDVDLPLGRDTATSPGHLGYIGVGKDTEWRTWKMDMLENHNQDERLRHILDRFESHHASCLREWLLMLYDHPCSINTNCPLPALSTNFRQMNNSIIRTYKLASNIAPRLGVVGVNHIVATDSPA